MIPTIDGHCHHWRLDRGDYGWLRSDTPQLAPIYRDFSAEDFVSLADTNVISQRVLVQAAPTEAETDYLLDLSQDDAGVAGVVGWVDLSADRSVEALERFAAEPAFKGVRPMLQDLDDIDWIATRPRPVVLDALERLGLRFDALVTPLHLRALLRFVERRPALPMIVDHAAKPALSAASDDPRRRLWEEGLNDLAGAPQVFCKLSGLLTELPPVALASPEAAAAALRPTFDRLLHWFGPERLVWGSDWPVLTLAAGYGYWLRVTDMLIDGLTAPEREAILAGTATRFYGLAEARAS